MRRDTKGKAFAALCAATAATLAGLACDQVVSPEASQEPAEISGPRFHVGCPAGGKFTGGGRIDPAAGKTTFGFNVHASNPGGDNQCPPIKGQLQVVHHPSKTLLHSETIEFFSSFFENGCRSAEFGGVARVKHVQDEEWHPHRYRVDVSDCGEPGRGRDLFGITWEGPSDGKHGTIPRTPLTGGNIQAHPVRG